MANGAGVWSITSSSLAQGTHGITATATDVAGNVSAASGALSVTDRKGAVAGTRAHLGGRGIINEKTSIDNITNATTPSLTGQAQADRTVKLCYAATPVGT